MTSHFPTNLGKIATSLYKIIGGNFAENKWRGPAPASRCDYVNFCRIDKKNRGDHVTALRYHP